MNKLIKKTESMIYGINYGKINFAKLVNLAIAQINHNKPKYDVNGNIVVEMNLEECGKYLKYKSKSISDVKRSLDRLIKDGMKNNLIESESKDEFGITTEGNFLITGFKTSTKTNKVTITFNSYFNSKILVKYNDLAKDEFISNRYIKYNMGMFDDCSNSDTLALYELFNLYSYKEDELFVITLSELKKYLDIKHQNVNSGKGKRKIKNETYLDYKIFKRTILSPSLKYIREKTDIDVVITKEERRKYTYVLNGEEKTVSDVDKICFRIKKKLKDVSLYQDTFFDMAAEFGTSVEKISEAIKKATAIMREENGIDIEEVQVVGLFKVCEDINLVRAALIDANSKSAIKNKGGYAYETILRVMQNNEEESYKKKIRAYYLAQKEKKDKKPVYKLTKQDRSFKSLVEIYEFYLETTGYVSEEDVNKMTRCLIKYTPETIKRSILNSSRYLEKNNRVLNGFGYVEMMLENNAFTRKEKQDIVEG